MRSTYGKIAYVSYVRSHHAHLRLYGFTIYGFTHLLQQLQLESLEERRKVQRLAFMYKILNGQVAVPAASVDLILSSRSSRGTDANQQKLITVRSYTENYRQSYSIMTVKDWNSLPQSVVSAGSLALFKSRLTSHAAP